MPADKLGARSFCIKVAGQTISFEISGSTAALAYKKIRHAFLDFSHANKRPNYKIVIKCKKEKSKHVFIRRPDGLSVSVWDRFIDDRTLWPVFIDNLVAHIYRLILSRDDIMMLHAAACAKGNKGYLFLGPSGSGKTTVATLIKNRAFVISDEKIALKKIGEKFYLFSFPIFSYEMRRIHKNIGRPIPLEKILLLKKSSAVKFEKVTAARAMAAVFERAKDLRGAFAQDIKTVFTMAHQIVLSVPSYEMHFKKDTSFWRHI